MKRYLCLILALLLLVSLCGCFDDGDPSNPLSNIGNNKTNKNRELCSICSGNKQVECNYCHGKGTYSLAGTEVLCMTCGGTAKMKCLGCNGTGYKIQFDDDSQSNSGGSVTPDFDFNQGGQYPGSCAKCSGRGVRTCTGCHGTGSIPKTQYAPDFGYGGGAYQTQVTCKTCSGTGIIDCPYC